MSSKLHRRPSARADQNEIASYLYQVAFDRNLADRWMEACLAEARYAANFPTQTPIIEGMPLRPEGPLRRRIIKGFKNYLLFYRFNDEAVTVTRILHGSRDLRSVPDL